jgi:hypothetical protein
MSKTPEHVTDNNVGNKNQKSCYSEGFKQHIRDTIERVRWDGVYLGAGDYVSLDDLKAICDYAEGLLGSVEQLESRLAQVERERDAAVYDIAKLVKRLGYGPCRYCRKTYDTNDATCSICVFEWRGVCEENTKEG